MSLTEYNPFWKLVYDWQTIIAGIAAIFGGLLAYFAGRRQAKATLEGARQQIVAVRSTLQADTMLRLTEKFDSDEFQTKLKKAAQACLDNLADKNPGVDAEDVLDFFEDIAFMVTKNALDEQMVWHGFYHWLRIYYQASEQYIVTRQRHEPAVWSALSQIYPRLNTVEEARSGGIYKEKLSDEELGEQLRDILT